MENKNDKYIEIPRKKIENYKKGKNFFKFVKIVAGIGTVVLWLCPLDGKWGELISAGITGITFAAEKAYDQIVDIPQEQREQILDNNYSQIKVIESKKKFDNKNEKRK